MALQDAQAMVQEALAGRTPQGMGGQPAPAPAVSNPQPGGFPAVGTPAAPVTPPISMPHQQTWGGQPVAPRPVPLMDVGTWGGQPMKAYNPLGPMVDSGTTMGGYPVKVPEAQLAGGAMWNTPSKDQIQGGFYVNRANAQNNARAFYDQPWDKDHARQAVGVANRQNNAQPQPFGKDSWRGTVARANGYQKY